VPEHRPTLVLFARAPVPGVVKTRLAPVLALEDAARLYRAFLQDASRVYVESGWSSVLYADPSPDESSLAAIFEPPWRRERQADGDLGFRLIAAVLAERSRGATTVLAVGSDHPALPRRSLRELFGAVESGEDAAVIPAQDGGYCAIALSSRVAPEKLFRGIPWSTDATLAITLDRARRAGLHVAVADMAYDVDRPADLERLMTDLASRDPAEEDYPHATAAALARIAPELA